jgi:hypothetical protein
MVWLAAALACTAAWAQAQSAPPASAASDSWSKPAAASSVNYGSSVAIPRGQQGSFRFKDQDKSNRMSIRASSPARFNGRPDTTCTSRPTAANCQPVGTRPTGN